MHVPECHAETLNLEYDPQIDIDVRDTHGWDA